VVSTTVRTTVKDSEQTEATSSTRQRVQAPDRSPAYKAQFGIHEKQTETSEESSWSLEATRDALDQFVNRYDFVSTAAGSMLVTTYCVMKGQCPATALMIAATATVTALVLNELMESSYYE
jgi:membrane carboxypeptidase/penicillin-binding protein